MFNHILIPTDLSGHAERAVDIATELATPAGATVTLLHVIQTIQGVECQEMESFLRRAGEPRPHAARSIGRPALPCWCGRQDGGGLWRARDRDPADHQ